MSFLEMLSSGASRSGVSAALPTRAEVPSRNRSGLKGKRTPKWTQATGAGRQGVLFTGADAIRGNAASSLENKGEGHTGSLAVAACQKSELVRIAGLEPANRVFSRFPVGGVSMLFIAHRLADKSQCCQCLS
jgi:hypothetical protein